MTAESRTRRARRSLGAGGSNRARNIGEGLMIVRMAPPPPPEFPARRSLWRRRAKLEPHCSAIARQAQLPPQHAENWRKPVARSIPPLSDPAVGICDALCSQGAPPSCGDSGASCADAFQADVSSAFKWASLGRVSSSCKKYCLFPIVQTNAIQLRLLCRCREFPAFHTGFRA